MGHLANSVDFRGVGHWSVACALVLVQATILLVGCSESGDTANPPPTVPFESGSPTDVVSVESSADTSLEDVLVSAEAGDVTGDQGCAHKSCAQLGAQCGSIPDECGGIAECGECPAGQNCGGAGPNKCGTEQCKPKTCAQLGASCGMVSDECGTSLSCGTCKPPETCGGGGVKKQCGCTPTQCGSGGVECGSTTDGCGGVLTCGDCPSGKVCGGGGPNKCGDAPCEPDTCAELGASCGTHPDGCKGVLNCGSCTPPKSCGGGGDPKSCGCTPETCTTLGALCGSAPDGCGATLSCGTCPYGTCENNKCSCTSASCLTLGAECGAPPDGCGAFLDCGTCSLGSCDASFHCIQPLSCSLPWGGSIGHGASITAYESSSVDCGSNCSSQSRTCTNGTLSGSYTHQSCANTGACGGSHNICQGNTCVPDCSDRAADYFIYRSDVLSYCNSDYCSQANVDAYWGGDTASCMQGCANWHWCTHGHNLGEWGNYGCRCYRNVADCTNRGFDWYPNPASTPSCD